MPLLITFQANEIAEYLRLDTGQEVGTVNTLKAAALEEAYTFLNTDFSTIDVNELGVEIINPVEAPAVVKEWVLNRIAQKFENRGTPVKPDYSTLRQYRVLNFSAPRNLNRIVSDTPETDAVNGVT